LLRQARNPIAFADEDDDDQEEGGPGFDDDDDDLDFSGAGKGEGRLACAAQCLCGGQGECVAHRQGRVRMGKILVPMQGMVLEKSRGGGGKYLRASGPVWALQAGEGEERYLGI